MKRKLTAILGVAALMTLAVVGVSLGGSTHVSTQTISDYGLEALGLDLRPLDAAGLAAVSNGTAIGESEARKAATARVGATKAPREVLHVMARIAADQPSRAVWLYLYDGSSTSFDQPWGPMRDTQGPPGTTDYTGVMIDDKTGGVLLMFLGGHQ